MNRRVLAIGAAGVAVLLVAWYLALWSPTNKDVQDAKDRQTTAEEEASQLQAQIRRLQAEQQNEPAKRARLEKMKAAIPDDPNLAQFILDTNDAAVKAGIDFVSVSPAVPTAAAAQAAAATTVTTAPTGGPTATGEGAPAEIRMTLQIQGGYFQLLDFLNRIDQMPRIVVTDGLNVAAAAGAGRLTVTITARMFTRSIPQGFAGAPTTTTTTTAPGATTTTTAAGGVTTTTVAGTATTSSTTTAGATP